MAFPWPPFPARLTPFGWSWGSTARGAAALTQGSVDTCVGVGFGLSRFVTLTFCASTALAARGAAALTQGVAFMLGGVMVTLYRMFACCFGVFSPKGGGPPAVTCTARRPAGLAAVAASP